MIIEHTTELKDEANASNLTPKTEEVHITQKPITFLENKTMSLNDIKQLWNSTNMTEISKMTNISMDINSISENNSSLSILMSLLDSLNNKYSLGQSESFHVENNTATFSENSTPFSLLNLIEMLASPTDTGSTTGRNEYSSTILTHPIETTSELAHSKLNEGILEQDEPGVITERYEMLNTLETIQTETTDDKLESKTETYTSTTDNIATTNIIPVIPSTASILSNTNITRDNTEKTNVLQSRFTTQNDSTTLKPNTNTEINTETTKFVNDVNCVSPPVKLNFNEKTGTNMTCTNDIDCPSSEGCRNGRCINLCVAEENNCPDHSICSVTNHVKFCLCLPGIISKDCRRGTTNIPFILYFL